MTETYRSESSEDAGSEEQESDEEPDDSPELSGEASQLGELGCVALVDLAQDEVVHDVVERVEGVHGPDEEDVEA